MKILYIHQYFRTPAEGGAIRSYYLAKGLVEHGIEVDLITAHNKPKALTKNINGINVHYLPVFYDNEQGFLKRTYAFFKFMRMARKKAREIKNVDICYATSTPLTIGLSALNIKRDQNIPYFFEVRDLWPEAPFQMGVIKNKYLKRYLKNLEKLVYRNASQIVALSPGIKEQIDKEQPNKPVTIIPNMSDVDFFVPEEKSPEKEKIFNVEGKFVVSYFGAIGLANHLEYLLTVANESLKADLPIKFFIIGNGGQLTRLKYLVKHFALDNVQFLPFQNKYNLKRVLNVTDAAYVSFARKPILETNSPNKFFDALASGKMIITNTKGWVKDIVEEDNCGFYYDPDEPKEFVRSIIPYLESSALLRESQHSAREIAETKFAMSAQIEKLIELISKHTFNKPMPFPEEVNNPAHQQDFY
jgi:glycosyltransferase involved in cell wall biosynthesis